MSLSDKQRSLVEELCNNFYRSYELNFKDGRIAQAYRSAYYILYTLADLYLQFAVIDYNEAKHRIALRTLMRIKEFNDLLKNKETYDLCVIYQYRVCANYGKTSNNKTLFKLFNMKEKK